MSDLRRSINAPDETPKSFVSVGMWKARHQAIRIIHQHAVGTADGGCSRGSMVPIQFVLGMVVAQGDTNDFLGFVRREDVLYNLYFLIVCQWVDEVVN